MSRPIGRSRCAFNGSIERATIGRSRNHRPIAQPSADRANHTFRARSVDLRDRLIALRDCRFVKNEAK